MMGVEVIEHDGAPESLSFSRTHFHGCRAPQNSGIPASVASSESRQVFLLDI